MIPTEPKDQTPTPTPITAKKTSWCGFRKTPPLGGIASALNKLSPISISRSGDRDEHHWGRAISRTAEKVNSVPSAHQSCSQRLPFPPQLARFFCTACVLMVTPR